MAARTAVDSEESLNKNISAATHLPRGGHLIKYWGGGVGGQAYCFNKMTSHFPLF